MLFEILILIKLKLILREFFRFNFLRALEIIEWTNIDLKINYQSQLIPMGIPRFLNFNVRYRKDIVRGSDGNPKPLIIGNNSGKLMRSWRMNNSRQIFLQKPNISIRSTMESLPTISIRSCEWEILCNGQRCWSTTSNTRKLLISTVNGLLKNKCLSARVERQSWIGLKR